MRADRAATVGGGSCLPHPQSSRRAPAEAGAPRLALAGRWTERIGLSPPGKRPGERGITLNHQLKVAVYFLATALLAPSLAQAQVTHNVVLTGPAFMIDGTAQVGDATLEVDVDVDELIDSLEMGGIAGYRLEAPRWSLIAEGAFMGLGQSNHGVSMDVDLAVFEVDAGYRFNERVEAFAGLRYTKLNVELATTSPISGEPVRFENDDDFLDPIVGARFATPLSASGRWWAQGRGDIGGFGVSMDFQWQVVLDLGYRPSESWAIWLGYRALTQDFEGAGTNDRLAMDVTYQGPQLGVSWTF